MANLDGTAGNDVLSGTSADDVITGFEGDDDLNGAGGNDTILGGSGTNVLFGGPGNDVLYVDGVDDEATGAENDDTIHVGFYSGAATILGGGISGGSGEHDSLIFHDATFDPTSAAARFSGFESVSGTINGTAGNDELYINLLSGAGIEASLLTINCGDGADFVAAGSETDVIHGGGGGDRLGGGIGNDTLYGDEGNDELGGGEGHNTIYGGDGNDILTAGAGGDVLYSGNGTNNLNSGFGNDILYTDGVDDIINGSAGDDTVHIGSLAGAAAILGGAVTGGTETDSLIFYDATFDATSASASFTAFESVAGSLGGTSGNDVLNLAGLTFAGLAAFQLTIGGGGGNDTITGGAEVDVIDGGSGNDTLNGGLGADRMAGGADNDTYHVDNAGDRANEAANAGADHVIASITFELSANVENLTLTGSGNTSGGGNALANVLTGNGGNNWLAGLAGNDTLDGGLGADRMDGGADNDTYMIDNTGDRANEGANAGTDQVFSSINFELGANVENLTLAGNGNTAGGGNALANVLTGNAGNNWLAGLAGNDTLNGGLGADRMDGGADNDTYVVDNAGDRVNESASAGTDLVQASISFQLGVNVENLTLTGVGNLNGGGNALANVLTGNSGNNWLASLAGNDVLDGGLGADRMDGGTDNDTYVVDNAGDRVNESAGAGIDLVQASITFELGANVENLTLTGVGNSAGGGNALANVLTGNSGNNWLVGVAGNDVLDGGLGADRLDGGADQDTFAFTSALGGGNVDVISGFVAADDTIQLENAVFTGLAAGVLVPGAFNTGASATQADDRIIYNNNTGALLFDVDGVGGVAAVHFATLSAGLALAPADFLVV